MPNQLIKVCDHCGYYYVSWPGREASSYYRKEIGSRFCGRYCYHEARVHAKAGREIYLLLYEYETSYPSDNLVVGVSLNPRVFHSTGTQQVFVSFVVENWNLKKEMTWLRIQEQQVIVCRLTKIVTELLLVRAPGLTQCEDSEAEKFLRKASRALREQLDWLLQLQRTWSMAA